LTVPAQPKSAPAPRLYAIAASAAPVVAVFRRGPASWWQLARWHTATGKLERGAWFRGALYPRRCDVSPDGALLYYVASKASRRPFLGRPGGHHTYSAISKLPWLTVLAAWPEHGIWTRGLHFVARGRGCSPEPPAQGAIEPLRARHGLAATPVIQYAVERRRGWTEHASCPPRAAHDSWDEKRSVILEKPQPDGRGKLILTDHGWRANAPGIEGRQPSFRLELGARTLELPDAAWADWSADGRLLVATHGGRLQLNRARSLELHVLQDHDLAGDRPTPEPAPGWAQVW